MATDNDLDKVNQIIQFNISALTESRALLEYEAADLVGVDSATWSRKRRGRVSWSLRDLVRIANSFDTTVIELLTENYWTDRRDDSIEPIRPVSD